MRSPTFAGRFVTFALSVGLRTKIMGIAVGLVILLSLGAAATLRTHIFGGPRTLTGVARAIVLETTLVSCAGLAVAYALTRVLTMPIADLRGAAHRLEAGDFGARARVWSTDEVGQLSKAFNTMATSMERMRGELQRKEALRLQLLDKLILAQEEERKRVARELHDETSQSLTSLMIGLQVVESARTLAEAKARLADLRGVASQTLDEVHRLALELRPAVLDDYGLVAALERHAADYEAKTHIPVELDVVRLAEERLPPRVETTLYRIVQEALTNVVRHAEASSVKVTVKRRPASVLLTIADNGKGFEPARLVGGGARDGHLGLYGMQERAKLLGGSLRVESAPGAGTTVVAALPITEPPELQAAAQLGRV